MLTAEYLENRIAHHERKCQEHVMAHDRSNELGASISAADHLQAAARHAAIFTALSAIAAPCP